MFRNILIKLLGGFTQHEVNTQKELLQSDFERKLHRMVDPINLDFASTLLKRWNEYRGSVNLLSQTIINNNPNYFSENPSLFFDLVLQDYYFRRLFLLQNKQDFFENIEENETSFHNKWYGGSLKKTFWELEPSYLEIIYSDNYIKDWNKLQPLNEEKNNNVTG